MIVVIALGAVLGGLSFFGLNFHSITGTHPPKSQQSTYVVWVKTADNNGDTYNSTKHLPPFWEWYPSQCPYNAALQNPTTVAVQTIATTPPNTASPTVLTLDDATLTQGQPFTFQQGRTYSITYGYVWNGNSTTPIQVGQCTIKVV